MQHAQNKVEVIRLAAENLRKQNPKVGAVLDIDWESDLDQFLSAVGEVCTDVSELLDEIVEQAYSSEGWETLTDREAWICALATRIRTDCIITSGKTDDRDYDADDLEDFIEKLTYGQIPEFLILCKGYI